MQCKIANIAGKSNVIRCKNGLDAFGVNKHAAFYSMNGHTQFNYVFIFEASHRCFEGGGKQCACEKE